jgi:hypothetical protein
VRIALQSASGPRVARIFHTLLGFVLLAAWLSLGQQVQLLIGSDGLLPLAPLAEQILARDIGWLHFPSLLVLAPGDAALKLGIALGIALALLAIAGIGARAACLLSAPLYLAYTVAGRDFTAFQWDHLLIECCLLAAWLPRRRTAPIAHWLMRLLLFKLYLESGIAKAQSHLGDWLDGSAMSFYYETAPLPAWPAWYAHQLPSSWHTLESWGALGLEGLGAFLILGPRPCRLAALVAFTSFQLVNLATANYGFFVYLTLALHVFLLDESDCAQLNRMVPRRIQHARQWLAERTWQASVPLRLLRQKHLLSLPSDTRRRISRFAVALFATGWIAASLVTACIHFSGSHELQRILRPIEDRYRSLRIANAYHLFGHITRERIEPEFQTQNKGAWSPHSLYYKPGDPAQAATLVAPHQPRVDFLLWFYGLSYTRGTPLYVSALLDKLCHDPSAVQELFPEPLPARPEAVRIEFWQYHLTTPKQRQASGHWWQRSSLATLRPLDCTP